jgi:hypothetical protein
MEVILEFSADGFNFILGSTVMVSIDDLRIHCPSNLRFARPLHPVSVLPCHLSNPLPPTFLVMLLSCLPSVRSVTLCPSLHYVDGFVTIRPSRALL